MLLELGHFRLLRGACFLRISLGVDNFSTQLLQFRRLNRLGRRRFQLAGKILVVLLQLRNFTLLCTARLIDFRFRINELVPQFLQFR